MCVIGALVIFATLLTACFFISTSHPPTANAETEKTESRKEENNEDERRTTPININVERFTIGNVSLFTQTEITENESTKTKGIVDESIDKDINESGLTADEKKTTGRVAEPKTVNRTPIETRSVAEQKNNSAPEERHSTNRRVENVFLSQNLDSLEAGDRVLFTIDDTLYVTSWALQTTKLADVKMKFGTPFRSQTECLFLNEN